MSFRAILLCAFWAASPVSADRVVVFAAASLKGPLDGAVAEWEATSGHEAAVSYGSSAALARQIVAGAPAQIYISANEKWADYLSEQVETVESGPLLGNSLVVVGPREGPRELELDVGAMLYALGPDGHMAIALTTAVPAGLYAREALETLGLWDGLAPRLAQTENVRAALALVARGETPLGIVYATDAMATEAVAVLARIPQESHSPIRYVMMGLSDDTATRSLTEWLRGSDAMAIFAAAGFLTETVR